MSEDGGGATWARVGVIAAVLSVVLGGLGIWVAHSDFLHPPRPTPTSVPSPVPPVVTPDGVQGATLDLVHNLRGDAGGIDIASCTAIDGQMDNAGGHGATAIVDCESSPPTLSRKVRFDRFPSPLAAEQYLDFVAGALSAGDCRTGNHHNRWVHGTQVVGSVVCVVMFSDGETLHDFFWASAGGVIVGQLNEPVYDVMNTWWIAHADTVPN